MTSTPDKNFIEMIDRDLTAAIGNGDIKVYLQPQYNSVTGEMIGAECLSRWVHKTAGFLNPAEFIPVLEQLDRVFELDMYVWETACGLISKWKKMGHALPLSVNISRKDIDKADLIAIFSGLVKKYDIEPSLLCLEITESAYMEHPDTLIEFVNRLDACGFKVEMDDFGTGFSSLSLLHDLYVDVLKLDMGFLKQTDANKRSGNIINAVVRMAHTMDMKVIAEGVEDYSQAEFLKNIGCLMVQGFYFSQPIPEEEFEKLLLSSNIYDMRNHDKTSGMFNFEELFDRTSAGYFIFNNCTGSAALLEYNGDVLQTVVANDKFVASLDSDREHIEKHRANLFNVFSDTTRRSLRRMAEMAIEDGYSQGELYSIRMKKYVSVKLQYMGVHDCVDLFFCEIRDITDEVKTRRRMDRVHKAQMEKKKYEKKLQVILEMPGVVLYEYDPMNDRMTVSVRGDDGTLNERSADEYLLRLRERNWIHPDDVDRYIDAIKSIKSQNDYAVVDVRGITKEGLFRHAKYYFSAFCDDDGKLLRIMGRAELMDNEAHETYLENLPVGTFRYIADEHQEFEYVGKSVLRLLGYESDAAFRQAYNNNFIDFIYPEDREKFFIERYKQTNNSRNYYCEYRVKDAAGNLRWMYDSAILSIDENGVKKYNVALSDMNRYKEEELKRQRSIEDQVRAYKEDSGRDMMTGLLNHAEFLKRVTESLDHGEKGIFAMIDIDNFKSINDTQGHIYGDQVICGLAAGLKGLFRDNDIVGRYGGDEFAFFLKGTTNKKVAARKAKEIISMASALTLVSGSSLSVSIGLVSDSSKAKDTMALVEMADSTLCRIKKSGKGTYGIYEPAKQEEVSDVHSK